MPNREYKEKLLGVVEVESGKNIIVTHVTIRQSISFLVLRLLFIEILAAAAIISLHAIILNRYLENYLGENIVLFNIPLFVILVIVKTIFMIVVILQWVNEYYEINTKEIVYKKGLIIRKEQKHLLEHIGSVKLEQGVFGRIFNFGTLKLFNWTREKYVYLYLIHNPMKYQRILEELLPDADQDKNVFREHLLEPDDNNL